MLLKPTVRIFVINCMFVVCIGYLTFFGVLFAFHPRLLRPSGYSWFPYRLWHTRRFVFVIVGLGMNAVSITLAYVLFKMNDKLMQI